MTSTSSWVEHRPSSDGSQLVVHLSGDDLRVLAAGVPVTLRAETEDADGAPVPGAAFIDVLVRSDRG